MEAYYIGECLFKVGLRCLELNLCSGMGMLYEKLAAAVHEIERHRKWNSRAVRGAS